MCVEAIASIATHYFYGDQPELALKYYRRLLQMGVYNAELYNNLGLCCFYAQQYDMTLNCFMRALAIATDETIADVWYNIGHVALGIGDPTMAYQCFRMALATNNDHAEAYNNLGVLEMKKGRLEMARAFFQAAFNISSQLFEPHYNYAVLADKIGDLQTSYNAVKRSLAVFPNHVESKALAQSLERHFEMI
jgi:tetratricopeptide repeat protein 8